MPGAIIRSVSSGIPLNNVQGKRLLQSLGLTVGTIPDDPDVIGYS